VTASDPLMYLDNNATTRPSEGVVRAMSEVLRDAWANPMSVHRFGQSARRIIENARESLATLIGGKPRDITFTSGGTEALGLAIRGALEAASGPRVLVTSRVEHAAVRELAEHLEKRDVCSVRWLAVDGDGVIQPDEASLRGATAVCVQWVNNETGAIQPVREIAEACARARATCIIDATQWVGKERTELAALGPVDMLAFAPHKFHGPAGVGCLWVGPGARIVPQFIGSQELGRRGGTENTAAISGAGVAANEAIAWLSQGEDEVRGLRDAFEGEVRRLVPDVVIVGHGAQRLWTTSNVAVRGLEAEAIVIAMSEQSVCVSAGAACSSGSLEPSPVLLAMGIEPAIAHAGVRVSFGRFSTQREAMQAARVYAQVVSRLRTSMPR
jgi:cysteine desulfurase